MKIRITEPIPSLNKTLKEHWAVKTKRKSRYYHEILHMLIIGQDKLKANKDKKCNIHIHSQRARKLDHDNLVGGAKSLLDALKSLRLIVDDSPEWVEIVYTQDTGKPYFTEIIIEEA